MLIGILLIASIQCARDSRADFEKDVIPTSAGELTITLIGHGTLMLDYGGKVIHIDPFGRLADYSTLPKADLVLITHAHGDHLDPAALGAIRTEKTAVVAASVCKGRVENAVVMSNGEEKTVAGITIKAVPAYNLVHKRDSGAPFHPKGEGNGYVLTFGDTRVYVAGDTENTPEMKALEDIDVAFLPMNLPYTMTPEMVADAARAFRPKILYPYHYGDTDPRRLVELLKDEKGIEVRVRKMR
jgi:L-ascorbate metabolism protein UlaG (beta-lactamase superfamily)